MVKSYMEGTSMKQSIKKVLSSVLAFVLIITLAQPALSVDATKTEQIQELLELTNAGNQSLQVMSLIVDSMKQSFPTVPNEWWDRFIAKADPNEIDALVIAIYDRHFSEEEINALVEFNRSPIGQSINAKMPLVIQESFVAGEQWGQRLAEEILRELETDGYAI